MAMIQCPECGREISDKASSCPNCGCPIGLQNLNNENIKKSKSKIFFIIIPIVVIIIVALVYHSIEIKKKEALIAEAMSFNDEIDASKKSGLPTERQIQDMLAKYDLFNNEQKAVITSYPDIVALSKLDIDGINKLQEKIDEQLSGGVFKYKDIIRIKEEYEQFTTDEQKYIKNMDEILKYFELTNVDKAALVGIKHLQSVLKNRESLQLENVKVKDSTNDGGKIYYVYIDYAAQNGFGGNKSSSAYFQITDELKDPLWALALLSGDVTKYVESNEMMQMYIQCKSEEEILDTDKLLANIDVEISVDE